MRMALRLTSMVVVPKTRRQLVLELDPDSGTVKGTLGPSSGPSAGPVEAFHGYVQLIAALEKAREAASPSADRGAGASRER